MGGFTNKYSWLTQWLFSPLRNQKLFLLVATCSWLLLFSMTKWVSDGWWNYLPAMLVDVYLLLLLAGLLPRRIRGAAIVLLYVLLYVLGFAESFLYQRYFMHITAQAVSMVKETTPQETNGFLDICLSSKEFYATLWRWGILLAAHMVLFATSRWIKPFKRLASQKYWCWSAIVFVGCLWVWVPQRVEMVRFFMLEDTAEAERIDNKVFCSTFWRIVYSLKFEQLAASELETLKKNMSNLKVGSGADGVPCIVLVVGESHNKHHSSVYGYSLKTTPFQDKMLSEGMMARMDNVVTPWNVTSMVFKEMFSTRQSLGRRRWSDGVLFPALLRKAGYRVSFLSNQFYKTNRQTTANYNGSFFLNSQPFDSLCFDVRNRKFYSYDQGLLKELVSAESEQREFVIIHLSGQHQPYAERVPKGKAKFKAQDIKRSDLTLDERQIVADYDNATLYNDTVLSLIYDRFKQKEAVIIYLSDHGEEVYDGGIGMFGRNHSANLTPEIVWAEFEVPFEVFFTPALVKKRPELIERAKAASTLPFSVSDVGHLILGLADISSDTYDASRNPLSLDFKPHPRCLKGQDISYEQIMSRPQ